MVAIDIGNTSLHLAWFREGEIRESLKFPTHKITKSFIKKLLSKYFGENILVVSVVPAITKIFESSKSRVYIIGKDIKVPIKCFYNKKRVGMDRLVGAFAARELFPKARFVLDFGTAITLDFLSKQGDYQGGIILPGVGSTLKALSNCALIPRHLEFKKTKRLIPQDTEESINKGLEEGFSLMLNSVVDKYRRQLKISSKEVIVVTGGEVSIIKPKLNFPHKYEPLLVLKGLFKMGTVP